MAFNSKGLQKFFIHTLYQNNVMSKKYITSHCQTTKSQETFFPTFQFFASSNTTVKKFEHVCSLAFSYRANSISIFSIIIKWRNKVPLQQQLQALVFSFKVFLKSTHLLTYKTWRN